MKCKITVIIKMLVITELYPNILFLVKSLEYNSHFVTLHLFTMQECHLLTQLWTKQVREMAGTNLSATPSRKDV